MAACHRSAQVQGTARDAYYAPGVAEISKRVEDYYLEYGKWPQVTSDVVSGSLPYYPGGHRHLAPLGHLDESEVEVNIIEEAATNAVYAVRLRDRRIELIIDRPNRNNEHQLPKDN